MADQISRPIVVAMPPVMATARPRVLSHISFENTRSTIQSRRQQKPNIQHWNVALALLAAHTSHGSGVCVSVSILVVLFLSAVSGFTFDVGRGAAGVVVVSGLTALGREASATKATVDLYETHVASV